MQRFLQLIFLFLVICTTANANNGRVQHIAWKENSKGQIIDDQKENFGIEILEQRNQFFQYKEPNNPLFKIRYNRLGIHWTILHFVALALTLLIQILTFRKINQRMRESRFLKRWSFRFLKLLLWLGVIAGNWATIWAIELYNTKIHFRNLELDDFKNYSSNQLQSKFSDRTYFDPIETTHLRFQSYRKKDGRWFAIRSLPVLHFKKNQNGSLSYLYDRRYLKLAAGLKKRKAATQLVVIHDQSSTQQDTALYFQIKNKQFIPYVLKEDKAKRILLFVNGYRPVSTSSDPERAFEEINSKGLEKPRSKNLIYNIDQFSYWPKERFLDVVADRISPDEILFADGHHSVSTSNHGSLIKFVSTTALYPIPCKGSHHCATTKVANQQNVRTYNLLATVPNYQGFKKRYLAGKQAGRNLLQELSSDGNLTQNDTLYVVSHSMGHAYLMGIASILRGKIQLASYWAFAPENPKGMYFAAHWWKEVYQYGTKLYGPQRHAPCQQDGVAPQWRILGLKPRQHIGFPKNLKNRMGYLKSHYIGYYDWVFEILAQQPGYLGKHQNGSN